MLTATVPAAAQLINTGVPAELQGVDIIDMPNAQLPLDTPFIDEDGRDVMLRDFFKKDANGNEKPVLLQLGYYKCPMLCGLVLNGLVDGLEGVDWTAGETFEVVAISINPRETPELARVKRDGYLLEYNRPGGVKGFHFLTGPASSSHLIAESVGFKFREQDNGEYSHAAAVFVVTPDGRLSRCLYGNKFEPKDLRLAILEASEGKIGSTLDRFILWCHMYDPDSKSYVPFARRIMQIGGVITLLILGTGLGWFLLQDGRKLRGRAGAHPV
ncbi:MAG: SCO family protein [Phycisphaerae bacterium]|nr:SCO family protein [Phycisphaerae bacterium]